MLRTARTTQIITPVTLPAAASPRAVAKVKELKVVTPTR